MDKRLFVTPERCIGCRSCEIACAFAHARALGRPGQTRVRAYTQTSERHVPVLCLQCISAACVKVCPTKALVRNMTTGAVEVRTERCVQCRMCTVACPFGNIQWDDGAGAIVKCDTCGGDPACARFCPTAALEWARKPTRNPPPKPTHVRPAFGAVPGS